MTNQEAAYILQMHNEWRRSNSDTEMQPANLLYIAILTACISLDKSELYDESLELHKYLCYKKGITKNQPDPEQLGKLIDRTIKHLKAND